MEAAVSPIEVSDSGALCTEVVEAVVLFSRIAHKMQRDNLVECAGLVQPVAAKAASSPGILEAVFEYCRSFLDYRLARETRILSGRQVSMFVLQYIL